MSLRQREFIGWPVVAPGVELVAVSRCAALPLEPGLDLGPVVGELCTTDGQTVGNRRARGKRRHSRVERCPGR